MTKLMVNPTRSDLQKEIADGGTLLKLARSWLKQGNPAVASELLDSAIQSSEADRDAHLRAQVLKEIGRVRMMQSDWTQAESCYLEAQRVFLSFEDFKGAAECARNRSNTRFQAGDFTKAEELCGQALEWALRTGDFELRATILNTMGAIKSIQGAAEQAVTSFRLCLADFEAAGNAIRQGYVLLNIGLAQIDLGLHTEARDSLMQGLSIALKEKDQNLVEICYQNIAKCYLSQNETSLAASVAETARKILPGLNSKALELELELLEATIIRAQGDLRTAERMLDEMLTRVTAHKLGSLVADVLYEQARTAVLVGDKQLAHSKATSAAKQYKEIGASKGLARATDLLQELEG